MCFNDAFADVGSGTDRKIFSMSVVGALRLIAATVSVPNV